MPKIFKLLPKHMARLYGQIGMFAFQRLHAGQLIHADRSFPLFCPLACLCVDLTSFNDLLCSLRIFFLGQPVPKPVGLEAPFFSSRAAFRGDISVTIPRCVSSSAISLPVHQLMGRPVFAGASQASPSI